MYRQVSWLPGHHLLTSSRFSVVFVRNSLGTVVGTAPFRLPYSPVLPGTYTSHYSVSKHITIFILQLLSAESKRIDGLFRKKLSWALKKLDILTVLL